MGKSNEVQKVPDVLNDEPKNVRCWVADIFWDLSESVRYGRDLPADITGEQLGRALEYLCLRVSVHDPMLEILKGWRDAERERYHWALLRVRANSE